jgi:hypothetical protein
VNCEWCTRIYDEKDVVQLNKISSVKLCSQECKDEWEAEQNDYLDAYNDYMAGYDVTFEKIKRKIKEEK